MNKLRKLMPWTPGSPTEIQRGSSYQFSLGSLQQDINRLFEHFYNSLQVQMTDWDGKAVNVPAVNISETPDTFKIEVELAGMDPKKVTVETTNGFLTIAGERREEKEERKDEKGVNYLREEIRYGSFSRTLALPETADGDKAKATFKNGILTVSVPKKAEAIEKPKKVEIREAA